MPLRYLRRQSSESFTALQQINPATPAFGGLQARTFSDSYRDVRRHESFNIFEDYFHET